MTTKLQTQLSHFGIPGMHWGSRGKTAKSLITKVKQVQKDKIIKPLLASQSVAKEHLKNIKNAKTPDEHKAAVKGYAESIVKSASTKPLVSWLKEAHQVQKNQLLHPILTSQANRASLKADSTANKLRRGLVYQNTNDLHDVNQRTAQLIANKKAVK